MVVGLAILAMFGFFVVKSLWDACYDVAGFILNEED